ncbi:MAG: response regulator [Bacteroidetes bacterium]|jgi:CheY-like chemotaxis protein|nr:response regulator [Bacteroidota bacterium]
MLKYSVLIADDDDSQRNVQKLVLGEVASMIEAELKIDETTNSVETRKFISENEYDLIILDNEFKDDLSQGHLPGIAILQLMRKSGPNRSSPTVFCSGDPYSTLGPMAERYGAVYYPKAKADLEELTKLYLKLLQK